MFSPQEKGKSLHLWGRGTSRRFHSTVENKDIMLAAMLTAGPVTTWKMVVKNRRSMRHISKEQYMKALKELVALGIGYITFVNVRRPLQVFIKPHPDQAGKVLKDMCTLQEYKTRYEQPPPSYLTESVIEWLIQDGHVPAACFKKLGSGSN